MNSLLTVNLRLAARSLNRNRLRTALTMLGIIMGVAAVLTMVALGTGARQSVQTEVSSAGTNLVFVKAGNYARNGESVGIVAGLGAAHTLVAADADAIAQTVQHIRALSPCLSVRAFIANGDTRAFARVQGVADGFALAYGWELNPGRMLHDQQGVPEEAVIGRALGARYLLCGGRCDEERCRGSAGRAVRALESLAEESRCRALGQHRRGRRASGRDLTDRGGYHSAATPTPWHRRFCAARGLSRANAQRGRGTR